MQGDKSGANILTAVLRAVRAARLAGRLVASSQSKHPHNNGAGQAGGHGGGNSDDCSPAFLCPRAAGAGPGAPAAPAGAVSRALRRCGCGREKCLRREAAGPRRRAARCGRHGPLCLNPASRHGLLLDARRRLRRPVVDHPVVPDPPRVLYFGPNQAGLVIIIAANIPANPAVLHLSLRLHRRAVLLALRDLDARYRSLVLDGPPACTNDPRILVPEPYAFLHTLLVPTWLTRLRTGVAGPHIAILALLAVGIGVASIAFGNCVVGFTSVALLYAAVYTAIDVANYVVSNSQVGHILSLHSQAESLLRDLASRSASADPTGTDSPGPRARARGLATRHADILAAHGRGAGGFLAKFAGAVLDAGVARTALVTAFTVGAGLWSVLKGSGVTLTMNTTCG